MSNLSRMDDDWNDDYDTGPAHGLYEFDDPSCEWEPDPSVVAIFDAKTAASNDDSLRTIYLESAVIMAVPSLARPLLQKLQSSKLSEHEFSKSFSDTDTPDWLIVENRPFACIQAKGQENPEILESILLKIDVPFIRIGVHQDYKGDPQEQNIINVYSTRVFNPDSKSSDTEFNIDEKKTEHLQSWELIEQLHHGINWEKYNAEIDWQSLPVALALMGIK